ncbi:MAG TPA: hemin uptake protein HemP [Anaeromyxobacteraceae bacterium]|nr:hemin uptake protein HemP [Anaeromyxobacteraceae bacterium]
MSRNIENGGSAAPARVKPRRTTSAELMGPDGRELVIEHAGEEYRLRITSTGKLILTK